MSDTYSRGRDQDLPTHDELVEQAETVLEATRASMYYPVAHGEAYRLQQMLERYRDTDEGRELRTDGGVETPGRERYQSCEECGELVDTHESGVWKATNDEQWWHKGCYDVIEKRCPNCGFTAEQVAEARLWHWCEDGQKYELIADTGIGQESKRTYWTPVEVLAYVLRQFRGSSS